MAPDAPNSTKTPGVGGAKSPGTVNKPDVVEPMIPHQHREDADRTPHAPTSEKPVVEPMIPHKNRREME